MTYIYKILGFSTRLTEDLALDNYKYQISWWWFLQNKRKGL